MKHIYIKIFALLSILALVSAQPPVLTLDYSAKTLATDTVTNQHTQLFSWFHAYTGGQFSSDKLLLGSPGNIMTSTVTDANFVLKAVSKSHSCALVYDASAGTQQMKLINFAVAVAADDGILLGNVTPGDDLIVLADVTGKPNTDFAVADGCMAVRVGLKVFHRTIAGGAFTADALLEAAAVAPVFNADFTFFVAADGIYKYNTVPATKIYVKITTVPAAPAFLLNKKIWTQTDKIVILHWAAGTAPAINYQLQVYSGAIYTQAVTLTGVSHTTAPSIALSSTLQTIVLSGKTNATPSVPFYTGKIVDFTAHTSVDLTINIPLITATESYITVTDTILYARNIVDNTATPPIMQHGAYYIVSGALYEYFKQPAAPAVAGWERAFILANDATDPASYITLYHQIRTAPKVITLQKAVIKPPIALFEWDRTMASTGTNALTGAAYSLEESSNSFTWFQQATANSLKQFTSMEYRIDPITSIGTPVKVTAQLAATFSLKATSQNKKCAILYNSLASSQALAVYNFQAPSSGTAAVFAANIISLTTVADMATNTFDISNNCQYLRIGAKFYYWNSGTTAYVEITTVPAAALAITNPVIAADSSSFGTSYIVGNAGIYRHVPRVVSPAAAAFIEVNRNDTFFDQKEVLKVGNNMIIMSYKVTATANLYDCKFQINTLVGSSFRSIYQNVGQTTGIPKMLASRTLSKVILYGKGSTGSSYYLALNVDYVARTVKQIPIPAAATAAENDVAISDDFLYIRNGAAVAASTRSHWGFIIMGSRLVQQFTEIIPYHLRQFYVRSFLIPDGGKLSVALQLKEGTNDRWYRVIKDQRKSAGQFLNPAPQTGRQMQFTTASTVVRLMGTFGKWSWVTGDKLNFVKWNPTVAARKTTTQFTLPAVAHEIEKVSDNYDCILTKVGSTVLNAHVVNRDTSAITLSDSLITLVGVDITTASNIPLASKQVGNECWGIRVNNFVYLNTAPTAAANARYTKSVTGSSLAASGAIFDSTFKYALVISSGAVHRYKAPTTVGGADYELLFTAAGLLAVKDFEVSQDGNKILLRSQDVTTNGVAIEFLYKLWAWNGSAWAQITTLGLGTTTKIDHPRHSISPDFETIAVQYKKEVTIASVLTTVPTAIFKKITYGATPTVTTITFPATAPFQQVGTFPAIKINNNYIFFYSLPDSPAGTTNSQIYFKIDKVGNRLVEFLRRQIPVSTIQSVISGVTNGEVYEDANKLTMLLQYEDGDTIYVIKDEVGTPETQSTLKNIQAAESGVVIVNGAPVICPAGCLTCRTPEVCTQCSNGFDLDTSNQYCVRCSSLCKTCDFATPTACLSCFDGYFKSGDACLRCDSSCRTCITAAATCQSCKVGFRLNVNTCEACISSCDVCDPNVLLCQKCTLGYVFNVDSNTCVKCISGCTNCDPKKIFTCLSCADGFEAVTTTTGTALAPVITINSCTPCPDNCKTCALGICSVCRRGFILLNSKCVEPCRLPCKECVEGSPEQCTSCVGNYNLNGNSCNPDLTCNTGSTCTFCPLGFNLVAGTCLQCNGGANCRTCHNTNVEKCAVCIRGYYLTQTSTCTLCSTGCAQCDDAVFCKRCRPGFTLSGESQASQCIKCHQSCGTCEGSAINCKTCATGYTRSGWDCITSNSVQFNLKLDGNFVDVLTSEITAVQAAVAAAVDKQTSQISLKQIRTGSIVIVGQIDATSTTQQAAIVSLLQTAYSSGSIGGFPILVSTFSSVVLDPNGNIIVVNNVSNNEDEVTRMRNIAIIVGVVIPIGLIIIFIVIFMLYKKGVICANDGPTKVRDMTMDEINVNQKDSEFNTMRKK